MEEKFKVGIITTTHGIRGEVKVFPTTDDSRRFKRLKDVLLDTGKEELRLAIEGVKFFKNLVILKFQGLDSINDVEKFKGCGLYVPRANAVRLRRDEYFVADLIGVEGFLEDGSRFGVLKDVLETGANDVYIFDTERYGEVLVPAIKDCILEVDVEAGKMRLHLLPGLVDERKL